MSFKKGQVRDYGHGRLKLANRTLVCPFKVSGTARTLLWSQSLTSSSAEDIFWVGLQVLTVFPTFYLAAVQILVNQHTFYWFRLTSSKLINVSLMSLLVMRTLYFHGPILVMMKFGIQYLLISVREPSFEFPHLLASVSVEIVGHSEAVGVVDPILSQFFCQT